jgi:multidrug efflux pump subunit AcrA (membrane-fusion protein)
MAELEVEHAERFPRADQKLFSRRDILQSEIEQQLARVRQDEAGALQELQRDLAQTELQLVDLDRRRAADEVSRARRALDALEVRAPRAGLLSWVRNDRGDLPQIGEQVWRGQTLAEMPRLTELGVEVFVVEADVGGIAPGSPALVTIDAHPEGSHRARVSRVDPVASRRFRGSPVLYFQVLLDLESVDLAVMKPGQRVTASILVEEVADALVVPRQALFSEAGGYVVYRVTSRGLEPAPVQVSAVARGLAVVTSGLEAGARVALAPPASEAPGGLRRALSAFMGRS